MLLIQYRTARMRRSPCCRSGGLPAVRSVPGRGRFRAVDLLAFLICKSNIEADFLTSFQLHDPAVVNHQLDRPVADRPEGFPELMEQRRG